MVRTHRITFTNSIARIGVAALLGITVCGTGIVAAQPSEADATTAAEAQAEAQSVYNEIVAMQDQLDKASADYYTALGEQITAQNAAADAQKQIDSINEEIEATQQKLGARACSMYRSGSSTFLDFLLGSTSFAEFTQNWNLLNQMNENDAELVQKSKDLRAQAEQQQAIYNEQTQIASDKAAVAAAAYETAATTTAQLTEKFNSLSAEAQALYAQEQAAAEAAYAAMFAENYGSSEETQYVDENGNVVNVGDEYTYTDEDGNTQTAVYTGGGGYGLSAVERAQSYLGNASYVWGACQEGAFDCSGFVSYCVTGEYERIGTTYDFMEYTQTSDPQPGDICTNSTHCGIYIGNGQMIHCSNPSVGVIVSNVYDDMIIVSPN